jgi:hypothetical protein
MIPQLDPHNKQLANYHARARVVLVEHLRAGTQMRGARNSRLVDAYLQLMLTTGTSTTSANVHDAWLLSREPFESSRTARPFDELADEPYRAAIVAAAAEWFGPTDYYWDDEPDPS